MWPFFSGSLLWFFLYYRVELSLADIMSYEARRMERRGAFRLKALFWAGR